MRFLIVGFGFDEGERVLWQQNNMGMEVAGERRERGMKVWQITDGNAAEAHPHLLELLGGQA